MFHRTVDRRKSDIFEQDSCALLTLLVYTTPRRIQKKDTDHAKSSISDIPSEGPADAVPTVFDTSSL